MRSVVSGVIFQNLSNNQVEFEMLPATRDALIRAPKDVVQNSREVQLVILFWGTLVLFFGGEV